MAKLKFEIELDWIDEESNIDDTIKDLIIHKVETTIVSKIKQEIQEQTQAQITTQIDGLVTTAISERIESFLAKPRNITDKYGEVIKRDATVDSMLKEQLESALSTRTLDKDGKVTAYSPKFSIFEFAATKNLQSMVNTSIEASTKNIKGEIETMVATALKAKIADNLTDMILKNSTVLGLEKKKPDTLPF